MQEKTREERTHEKAIISMAPWSSFSMCQKVYRILASHDRLATVRNVKQAGRGRSGAGPHRRGTKGGKPI